MRVLLGAVLAAVAIGPNAGQDRRVVREHYADGGVRCEYEVKDGAEGEAVRDGSFKSFHPDGSRDTTGRYRNGLRRGKWRSWYANGKRRAIGNYVDGLRDGKWDCWNEDGSVDPELAGEYETLSEEYRPGVPRCRGEARGGLRHGRWTLYWENGAVKASGGYRDGVQEGEWRFRHPDGTPDPSWISGTYEKGVRIAGLEAPPTEVDGAAGKRMDLLLPQFRPYLIDVEKEKGRELIGLVSRGSPEEIERASGELRKWGRAMLPVALELLLERDLTSAEQSSEAGRIQEHVLIPLAGGITQGWRDSTESGDVAANRLTVLRWASFWKLVAENPELREIELPPTPAKPEKAPRLLETVQLALDQGSSTPVGLPFSAEPPFRNRFLERSADARSSSRGTDKYEREIYPAVDLGLRWLVAHQSAEGHWSSGGFSANCGMLGSEKCDGAGEVNHDVGVTGLALLALLGDGNTTRRGHYRDAVSRGVGWLIRQQDPKNGLIGKRRGHSFIYNHAVASLALCEAACFSDSQALRDAVTDALGFVSRARNPDGGWRYDYPPTGENDTSVTAWMVQVLVTAQWAGLPVSSADLAGATKLILALTHAETGRVGYDTPGTYSSRISGLNDHFDPEWGEALTAAGYFCRRLTGEAPDAAHMAKYVDLIAAKPPDRHGSGLGTDTYYWYYGTHAMRLHGGRSTWLPWREALKEALVDHQRQDQDTRGSWDPEDVWAFAGGRIYSTALSVLALEAPFRFEALE